MLEEGVGATNLDSTRREKSRRTCCCIPGAAGKRLLAREFVLKENAGFWGGTLVLEESGFVNMGAICAISGKREKGGGGVVCR